MSTESTLTDLLTSVAEDAPVDELGAWDAISAGMRADSIRRRRTRWAMGAGGALLAGAAAALIAVAGTNDTPQAVDVSPPATESPVVTPGTPDLTHALPVIVDEFTAVEIRDVVTGELLSRPLELNAGELIQGVTLSADGSLYSMQSPPGGVPELLRTPWNGGPHEVIDTSGAGGADLFYPVISPDGSTLAFSASLEGPDPLLPPGAIALMDIATGEFRFLEWEPGDNRAPLKQPQSLSWSSDGTHIAFMNGHDTDGTDAYEAYTLDLEAAGSLMDAELIFPETWSVAYAPNGGVVVVEYTGEGNRLAYGVLDLGIPQVDGRPMSVERVGDVLVVRTDDGRLWHLDPNGTQWLPMGTTTETAAPTSTTPGPAVELPARPIAVVADHTTIEVYDLDTGALVKTLEFPAGGAVSDATLGPDGTIYWSTGTEILAVPWEGGLEDVTTLLSLEGLGIEASFIGYPAVSPDGSVMAFSLLAGDTGALGLYTFTTGAVRVLEWPEGDSRGLLTQPQSLSFIPEELHRLAFVNVHDTDGTEAFEAYTLALETPDSLGDALLILPETWSVAYAASGGIFVVEYTPDGNRLVCKFPDREIPQLELNPAAVQQVMDTLVVRTDDGRLWRLDADGTQWLPTGITGF